MSEHTPTLWEACDNKSGYPSMRPVGKHGRIVSYFARVVDQQRVIASVNAFHSPDGRKIATEDIAEGCAFQMRDLLEAWYRLCTNPQISAETYWREHPKLIARMEALFSTLKVQGPET